MKKNTTVQQCVALAVSKLLNLLRRFACVSELLQVSRGEALTSPGGADLPLHLLTLSKCMQIYLCTLSINTINTYSIKNKGRMFY